MYGYYMLIIAFKDVIFNNLRNHGKKVCIYKYFA